MTQRHDPLFTRRRFVGTGLGAFAAAALPTSAAAGLGRPRSQEEVAPERELWKNWSGAIEWSPRAVERATSEQQLADAVRESIRRKETLRVAGTGHSFVPLCATSGTTALLTRLARERPVVSIEPSDAGRAVATVAAGAKLGQLTAPLFEAGWALETLPDIDRQSVAGATATATHGTGLTLGSLSTLVLGATLIDGQGELREFDKASDPEVVRALAVHLGALGVLVTVKLRVVKRFRLHERTEIVPYEVMAESLEERIQGHRHFEFFWVSQQDACLAKTLDITSDPEDREETQDEQGLVGERVGWSGEVFPSSRTTRFNELEYVVPRSRGRECWAELRELMRGRWKDITWPIEYRTVQADDTYLGMNRGEDVVTLSLHQAAALEYEPFFRDAEAIARNHGGRPHWGKMHYLEAPELEPLYPRWDAFQQVRKRLDPSGVFQTPYLKRLLG